MRIRDGGTRSGGQTPSRRQFLRGVSASAATLVVGCARSPVSASGVGTRVGGRTGSVPFHPDGGGPAREAGSGGAPAAWDGGAPRADAGRLGDAGRVVDASAHADGGVVLVDSGGCLATHPDIEGPFYRPGIPVRSELDLYGEVSDKLALSGVVLDARCDPIEHAIVEIWNADSLGAYDTTTVEHRYYGQQATDASGVYAFHTILPARYLNGAQYRPRHVHLKVWMPERSRDGSTSLVLRLTTQIYFEGDPYNEIDPWWDPERTIALAEKAPAELAAVFDVQGILA